MQRGDLADIALWLLSSLMCRPNKRRDEANAEANGAIIQPL